MPPASPNGAPSTETNPAAQTVAAFLSALEDLDVDRALTYVDPEIVYQNVPLPPARGIRAFERQMRLMTRYGTGFEARTHHVASNGPIVLNVRTDVLEVGAWRSSFWVCGTFKVRDGRIVLWRDHFDWATVLVSAARGAVRALATSLGGRKRVTNVGS